jgi:dipeptidyl aminopeptidase/acylaminoacyl peptidase
MSTPASPRAFSIQSNRLSIEKALVSTTIRTVNTYTTTIRNAVQFLLAARLLLALTAGCCEGETESLLEHEKAGIDKIAQLTAKEHSTILFTIASCVIGYAKNGHIEWISSGRQCGVGSCGWPHQTLSHDGSRVAFVAESDTPKHCRIVIHDMPTGVERNLIETTEDDPGEISWSWDDAEVSFFDHGISAVSVREGTKRMLLPFPTKKIGDRPLSHRVWFPMEWLHNGKDLVVELETEIPTKEPGTYTLQSNLVLVSGDAHLIGIGSQPAVSPLADRIAYYASDGVVAINADGTGRVVLTKAPTTMLFFEETLFWNIVWSPDGNRLFFGTIVSEDRRDDLYLLDVESGRRKHFLSRTSITIRGWH